MNSTQEIMVVKSNELIDGVFNMTLTEQRLLLCALAQVPPKQNITDQVLYTIHAADYADLVDRSRDGVYEDLSNAATRLANRDITLFREPNTGKPLKTPLITKFIQTRSAYVDGEGQVSFRFSHDIIPYLSNLNRRFTKINMFYALRLPTKHAARLYEQFLKLEVLPGKELEISFIREMLQLGDQYKAIKDLKKYVIDSSIKAINETSNLVVSYDQRKIGKRVASLRFDIRFKENPPPIPQEKLEFFTHKTNFAEPSEVQPDEPSLRSDGQYSSKPALKKRAVRLKTKDDYVLGFTRSELQTEARPGESWDQVAQRLANRATGASAAN